MLNKQLDNYLEHLNEISIIPFIERNWKKILITKGIQGTALAVILRAYRKNDLDYKLCREDCKEIKDKFFKKRKCNKKCLEIYKMRKMEIKKKVDSIKKLRSLTGD